MPTDRFVCDIHYLHITLTDPCMPKDRTFHSILGWIAMMKSSIGSIMMRSDF
jgi:hypothetical protein